MAQTINTNVASLNAQRNLNRSQGLLNQSLERLSTGLRINSAKDDAAGLAISEVQQRIAEVDRTAGHAMTNSLLFMIVDDTVDRAENLKELIEFMDVPQVRVALPENWRSRAAFAKIFYRLSVIPIEIPPLRERPEGIAPLVREMTERVYRRYGVELSIAPGAKSVLENYSWPGNARELANLIERLAVLRPDGRVDEDALPWPLRPAARPPATNEQGPPAGEALTTTLPTGGLDLKEYLAELEREMIRSALERADGVVQQAADELGVRRTTLVEKINRHKLRSNG